MARDGDTIKFKPMLFEEYAQEYRMLNVKNVVFACGIVLNKCN